MIFAEEEIETAITDEPQLVNFAASADKFEGYRLPHACRIADLADALALRLRFARQDRIAIRKAALLHDVGEMLMAREYLSGERKLDVQERLDLQRHPVIGEQEAARRDNSKAVQLLVRWHHEWWNGTGYPDRLEAAEIPLAARILRICDTYSALTSARPFRIAFTFEEADRYIAESAGIEFDPHLSKLLLSIPERHSVEEDNAGPRPESDEPEDGPVHLFGD